jgi:hypothetical protein
VSATAKVSVAIGRSERAWAKTSARRQGKSLSTVVTESLAERRRLTALAEVVEWMGHGESPLTDDELRAALADLAAGTQLPHPKGKRRPTGKPRRR